METKEFLLSLVLFIAIAATLYCCLVVIKKTIQMDEQEYQDKELFKQRHYYPKKYRASNQGQNTPPEEQKQGKYRI